MKVPVYLTVSARDPMRLGMALCTSAFWSRHSQADLRIVSVAGGHARLLRVASSAGLALLAANVSEIPLAGSQMRRHVVAAEDSSGSWAYVSADEDVLPRPEADLRLMLDYAEMHPRFGMIALSLPDCPLHHEDPGFPGPRQPVMECGAAGGVRLMRREAVAGMEWPPPDPGVPGYDVPLAEALRARGWRVGFFTDGRLRANHLGGCYSTVWAPHTLDGSLPVEFHRGARDA